MPPTDLMDVSYFGTEDDKSDVSINKYYKTANNLPWAINIPSSFDWPREKIEINWAYYHFIEWAESLGINYDDWYLDLSGYRNNSNIYNPTP
jgi:LruC domain-containing protein